MALTDEERRALRALLDRLPEEDRRELGVSGRQTTTAAVGPGVDPQLVQTLRQGAIETGLNSIRLWPLTLASFGPTFGTMLFIFIGGTLLGLDVPSLAFTLGPVAIIGGGIWMLWLQWTVLGRNPPPWARRWRDRMLNEGS